MGNGAIIESASGAWNEGKGVVSGIGAGNGTPDLLFKLAVDYTSDERPGRNPRFFLVLTYLNPFIFICERWIPD